MEPVTDKKIDEEARKELLAEYTVLRDEVLKRIEMRHKIMGFTLIVAGTCLTLVIKDSNLSEILLIYPIFAMFLAIEWMHNDVRIGEIGQYIKDEIESKK